MENNTKKNYETPEAEKIMFNYRDQVVAASQSCSPIWTHAGDNGCTTGGQQTGGFLS